MKEIILNHLKSAAITFLSAFSLEIYTAFQAAEGWDGLMFKPLVAAASFVAVRAILRAAVKPKG